jgi:hypothetical protein
MGDYRKFCRKGRALREMSDRITTIFPEEAINRGVSLSARAEAKCLWQEDNEVLREIVLEAI